jgi:very-short-patch-repair endonuclease
METAIMSFVLPRKHRTSRARQLRHGENQAEAVLWNCLKASQLGGYKFVRQFPLGPYFCDFAQRQHRLVIELDGSQHVDSEHDQRRDQFMQRVGYSILRFWSGDVLRNKDAACATILAALVGEYKADIHANDMRYLRAHDK